MDIDGHVHAEETGGQAEPGARQRQRLVGIARYCNTDEPAIADDAVGGIELDPTGAGQEDADPGMGIAPADDALASAWYRQRTLPVLVTRVLNDLPTEES